MMLVFRQPLGVEKFDAIFLAQNLMLSAFECSLYKFEIDGNLETFVSYAFEVIFNHCILTSYWLKCYFYSRSTELRLETLALSRFHKAALASLFEERN